MTHHRKLSQCKVALPISRILQGEDYTFEETLEPKEMELTEEFLRFEAPIQVQGTAYKAGDAVVYYFQASTHASVSCTFCCEFFLLPLDVKIGNEALEPEELDGIENYDLWPIIRQELLLSLPNYAQCRPQGCPEREQYAHIIKNSSQADPQVIAKKPLSPKSSQSSSKGVKKKYPESHDDTTHQPFANLDQLFPKS
jgi:uncharacterized metal-binding protein YceD (DUF177 family)